MNPKSIVAEMLKDKPGNARLNAEANGKFRQALDTLGDGVIDVVLDELLAVAAPEGKIPNSAKNGWPLFQLSMFIEFHIKPEHGEKLCQLLLLDQVARTRNRILRSNFLHALGTIPDPAWIPTLKTLLKRVALVEYKEFLDDNGQVQPGTVLNDKDRERIRLMIAMCEKVKKDDTEDRDGE